MCVSVMDAVASLVLSHPCSSILLQNVGSILLGCIRSSAPPEDSPPSTMSPSAAQLTMWGIAQNNADSPLAVNSIPSAELSLTPSPPP